MKDIKDILEFSKIVDKIHDYCATLRGKKLVSESLPYAYEQLTTELKQVDEMMQLVIRFQKLPITSAMDLTLILQKADKDMILTPEEINYVKEDLMTSKKVRQSYFDLPERYFSLTEIISPLKTFDSLLQAINKVLAPDLSIYDDASPTLKLLRKKKRTIETKINQEIAHLVKKYASILSDTQSTIRNNRFVLPVLAREKNKIEGIIQDVSSSGQTTFIEPTSMVSFQNELYLVEVDEKEEIQKILHDLTRLIHVDSSSILQNNEILGYLDFLQAKAQYGLNNHGHVSQLSDLKEIQLFEARHPLIDSKKVVANTFIFTPTKNLMVISGPNAGGKTVAIKTVGLNVYMHLCAIPLLTNKPARIGYFPHIYVDIGDNQSLEDNLSTFSSHMENLALISRKATENDLVIIDELGTGTDPSEGEAIGLAFLSFLNSKQITSLVTSHYGQLKQLAYTHSQIFNASLVFDEKNLSPTYHLKLNIPGRSYGLVVAERYGLNKSILNEAYEILKAQQNQDVNLLLSSLQAELQALEEKKTIFKEEQEQFIVKLKQLEKEQGVMTRAKQSMQVDLQNEKSRVIKKTQDELDEIIKKVSQGDLKLHEIIDLKRAVDKLEIVEEVQERLSEVIEVGDYVEEINLGIQGKVVEISKKATTLLTSSGKSFQIKDGQFQKIEAPKNLSLSSTSKPREINITGFSLELNLLGLRVNEALEAVKNYLDTATLKGLISVRLIHGYGTGALRQAIHEYLKTSQYVKSFRLGESGEGGYGATVVYLK